jgi:hypothetical protein
MDRRQFCQSTTGAVLASAISPVTPTTERGFLSALAQSDARSLAEIEPPWLNSDPTRIGWFILRDLDVASDPNQVIEDAVTVKMNCVVLTAGGSIAFYPSTVPFHVHSPSLKGRDFFGDVAAAGKERGIRIGARFDFSRQSKDALEAHPEWFFRHADGSPATDSTGCFSPCLSTDFYHTQAIEVISEVMDHYRPELLYINWFVNSPGLPSLSNAGGVDPTICRCESCESRYEEQYGKPLPANSDAEYQAFMKEVSDSTSQMIADTIHERWPGTLYINADNRHCDGQHTEARTPAGLRTWWAYSSSESVDRQRNSYPERAAINICTGYYTNLSRLVLMPEEEMRVHFYQASAHGSPLCYSFTGTTLTQDDQRELDALREIYAWHAANADLYTLQVNLARVLLLCEPERAPRSRNPIPEQTNRGVYRILAGAHIPIAVSENPESMQRALQDYDLVIVTEGASMDGVKEYVENGGRALFIYQPPPFGIPPILHEHSDMRTGYAEIRDPGVFPSLAGVRYLNCSGAYSLAAMLGRESQEPAKFYICPDEKGASLTFVAPMLEQPAEFAHRDLKHSEIPALINRQFGEGRIAFVPWDIGGLYARASLPIHANLFCDIVDSLLPDGRQIRSNAHPSIEMVLMSQPDKRRAILHLINCSGQSQDGFFQPIPFESMDIDVMGSFSTARARVAGEDLKIVEREGRSTLRLPMLRGYEAIVLT